jgi:hypothetical protein
MIFIGEAIGLAERKGTVLWKALGMLGQGSAMALTGKASDAAKIISAGLSALKATGATTFVPWHLTYLARAYMAAGQFPDAWRCIRESLSGARPHPETAFQVVNLAKPDPKAPGPQPVPEWHSKLFKVLIRQVGKNR